jgi:hypothetical protein
MILRDPALLGVLAAPTPSPTGTPGLRIDENAVTPGWVGFALTFLLAVVVVALVADMTRRIRRVRYRAEIRERLEAEAAEPGSESGRATGV